MVAKHRERSILRRLYSAVWKAHCRGRHLPAGVEYATRKDTVVAVRRKKLLGASHGGSGLHDEGESQVRVLG